ncbi:MAG: 6-carboxytetrahydropterin synthase [Chitinophagaceae bacterium]|jgi:6-pyruvoyltetrahydropterin/6-carboxytetrahydropterin synthase|nr:6-carboxytetrahydropterin synthase [Chitinophagaceae bacterium]MBP6047656.1 6-carboxytetrahydropterin synthase [Ferruginibacter sp.]NMD29468.1 6-carboxytetrahydropterin synthase [Bacteroidota bacterium]MBK7346720.1 6-carboxytetrahydropterin synthase [Chitinophagaceae bacterium]MBK7735363.1 6-carboxytetrahydropterin synthase [Chitinophagaceae bacterium]
MEQIAVFRKESFNAAHRLYNPVWSNEENNKVFGKCSNPNYHGHNYELIVKLVGTVNPKTGFVMDMKELSDIIQREIIERFDHKNLNVECVEFRNVNPTAENIAIAIYNLLRPHILASLQISVRLYETPRNFVQYPA